MAIASYKNSNSIPKNNGYIATIMFKILILFQKTMAIATIMFKILILFQKTKAIATN